MYEILVIFIGIYKDVFIKRRNFIDIHFTEKEFFIKHSVASKTYINFLYTLREI